MAGFPYCVYRPESVRTTLRDTQGSVHLLDVPVHDPDLSRLRDCNRMESPFAERGVLWRGTVGTATARLMTAGGVLAAMQALAQAGFTMYDDPRVPDEFRRHPGEGPPGAGSQPQTPPAH